MAALRAQFEKEIRPLTPVVRSPAVSGWSIQSADGDYRKGLEAGFLPNNGPGNRGPTWVPRKPEEASLLTMQDFAKPTTICTGHFLDVLRQVEAMGFNPRRARILKLAAGTQSTWHVDGQPQTYSVRLHIPIITNRQCFFNYENESFHMAADGGGYLVKVNRLHMIHNKSNEDRFHLVMNVWDQEHRTRFHHYAPD